MAMEISGTEYSAEALMKEIEKEIVFMDRSEGGVTFCGGEPLLHPGPLLDLLRRCGERGIHRAVDTTLIARPEILFLDEPTLGLDVLARAELWDVVRQLKGRITVILTTHYLEEAEALSDRVGIMKDGRLLALGTPEELKRQAGCDRFEDAFIAMVREAGR